MIIQARAFLMALLLVLALTMVVRTTAQGGLRMPDPSKFQWVTVVDGLDNPLYITHSGDGTGRLFVVQQTGLIFVIKNGSMIDEPFLDISEMLPNEVFTGGYTERGLLGLAFHPDFARNATFYINYTDQNGDTNVARYKVMTDNPDKADPASRTVILFFKQPFANHNGGHMAFGPDGYLYISSGDGGDRGDPLGNGQKTDTLLGKLLRIDVNTEPYAIPPTNPFVNDKAYAPEIWALGLRNPWRFSFDRATGDMYIGDVGQEKWEEINFQPANSKGGENYGWNMVEGNWPYADKQPPADAKFVKPVIVYGHEVGCSVTGGYVYRGKKLPQVQGIYFFGDYCNGRIWTSFRKAPDDWRTNVFMHLERQISSFGEDQDGELYMVDYKGAVLRLEAK